MPPRAVALECQTAWNDQEAIATDRISFTLYERATLRAIGGCGLTEVDHRSGTVYLVILIEEADARGQGYWTGAVRPLVDVAFSALGLHSIMLGVWEFNHSGRRAHEKAGFQVVGRRR